MFSNQNRFVTLAINDNLPMKLNFKESNEPKLIKIFIKNIQQKIRKLKKHRNLEQVSVFGFNFSKYNLELLKNHFERPNISR